MIGFKSLARKTINLLLALALVSAQLFAPISAIIPKAAAAGFNCTNDTAGANDEPGQKDLTRMCVNYDGVPTTVSTTWNWDDLGTSGANTLDACNLFDTDSDGKINYAVCVTTTGNPASIQTLTTYSCGDDKVDRCTSPNNVVSSGTTSCSISSQNTDPFPAGDVYPTDIQGACTIQLSTVGGSTAQLVDVCSYPSQQPNSDPSDCVIFITQPTALVELIKNIIPVTDAGRFNLTVDGPSTNDTTTVTNQGNGGTTGIVNIDPGNGAQGVSVSISESAFTGTTLANYTYSVSCIKRGTSTVVATTGTGPTWSINVKDGDNVVCTITNTASSSITIVKDAIPNDIQDFAFTATGTGTNNFTLDDDSDATLPNTVTFNNLSAGTYTFTEGAVSGWYLDGIECPNITETKDLTTGNVSLTITAGQNITCTFTNRKLGQIVVTKQTNPNGDPQVFSITASGTNNISGNTTRDIIDDETETYTVRHGEYDVNEQDVAGWIEDDSACQDLVINGNTPLVSGIPTLSCTITNTKLATLIIIKNALPDHEQDFAFTTSGTGLSSFSLDDDSDGTLQNQVTFSDLTPNQQYSVTEQSTPGWSLTGLSCNDVAQQGSTATVTPTPGQTITCTFTNTKLISVSGTKFEVDAGATDGGLGTVLGGWTIYIDSNNNGRLDDGELSDVTDENGNYSFSDLLYGTTVTLREILQAGWTQIFGPDTFTLDSADDVTDKDFGNFENATISGFKWNDKNADDIVNEGEEKLNGWTITLYNDGDDENTDLDDVVTSTVTAGEGAYSFTNLTPGTYAVCETQQAGWVQTFPNDNGCHTLVIDESGETEQANFGNQGRGTITVIKNVDTDGDGQVDDENVGTWTWDIDGTGDFATGSGNSQSIAAGTYDVSEDQQTDFHFVSVSCSGEERLAQDESVNVTVSAGENVVCTFVNARDTGTIEVIKELSPESDDGVFDLQIKGTTEKEDAGDGDTTGAVNVVTGTYDVSELAGNETTDLDNYDTTLSCTRNEQAFINEVATTASDEFTVSEDDVVVCTFTNVRRANLTVIKDAVPNDAQDFHFTISEAEDFILLSLDESTGNNGGLGLLEHDPNEFDLDDDDDGTLSDRNTVSLSPGIYTITEDSVDGWDLDDIDCGETTAFRNGNSIDVFVNAGDEITCTFENHKRATVTVTKYNDYDRDGEKDDNEPVLPDWEFTLAGETEDDQCEGIGCIICIIIPEFCGNSSDYEYSETQTTTEDGTTTFTDIKAGVAHELTETLQDSWFLSQGADGMVCRVGEEKIGERTGESYSFSPEPGAQVNCFVGNYRDAYILLEKTNNRPAPTVVGDTVTYTLIVTVPEDSNPVYGATVTDLPPEGFEYVPGSETATKGSLTSPYASPGIWTLGDLFPGEVVVLTYQTRIADSASAGTYPDLAFAEGCDVPVDSELTCTEENAVLANVSAGDDTPFVGTEVTIRAPQVLGANTTVLVNTGTADIWKNMMIGTLLMGAALATLYRREQKGGRA